VTVTLISVGSNKINVIKALRGATGLGLKEAKHLVDNAPQLIKRGLSREAAEAIRRMVAEAGASVRVD